MEDDIYPFVEAALGFEGVRKEKGMKMMVI